MVDYSKTILHKGIVCFNTNNYTKCVVIDGNWGTEQDRSSLILELIDHLMVHAAPNRALIPTGEYVDLPKIEELLRISPDDFKKQVMNDGRC